MSIFPEYKHLKRFVWTDDNISAYKRPIGPESGTFSELAIIDAFCRRTRFHKI